MKVVTVVGARPQFIKASVVSREFAKDSDIKEIILHTGQHYDENMSKIFFDQMEIPKPDYNLDINRGEHGSMTGRMLEGIEKVLLKEKPDLVLVYGDTNSTLAGAIASKKLKIKLAHVEAGLRSYNQNMPEEINRILTDRISDYLFYPTPSALTNLKNEGFPFQGSKLIYSGDVMYDAALYYSSKISDSENILDQLSCKGQDFVLCTVHRSENTDSRENLESIVNALDQVGKEIKVFLPLHPRTRQKLDMYHLKPRVSIIEPLGYLEMIQMLKHSRFVMTDSGGLQKEAYFFKRPCLTLREETEWVELVEKGYNILCGSSVDLILSSTARFLSTVPEFEEGMYGDGNAASIVKKTILNLEFTE